MRTYGLELEWADVDRRVPLPPGTASWSETEYTLVNTDGHANHPFGEYPYGGELNTVPTDSIAAQVRITQALAELLVPEVTYRCHLHTHVAVPGLVDDLPALQRLVRYCVDAHPFLTTMAFPITRPAAEFYADPDEMRGAVAHYNKRRDWCHRIYTDRQREGLLAATDMEAFWYALRPFPRWRYSVNIRSLRKHGTVEFRHFAGTTDPVEVADALAWSDAFLTAALDPDGPSIEELYFGRAWRFPAWRPYDHALETRYALTKFVPASGYGDVTRRDR